MLTLDEIIEKLKDRNLREVARRIDITASYLSAIVRGERMNPSYEVLKKLSDYLQL